ncbi:hypothetical protein [Engelhardtia mirabilis]|uniref:hypothetical protein n=1 Tax=Engelhardtia mirabilis TaxID=2528011 RepID=UPI0011A0FBF8
MNALHRLTLAFVAATAALVSAAPAEIDAAPPTTAHLSLVQDAAAGTLELRLSGAAGERCALSAGSIDVPGVWLPLPLLDLDPAGSASVKMPAPSAPLGGLVLRAEWLEDGRLRSTQCVPMSLEQPLGDIWDMGVAFDGSSLSAGDVVSSSQPWSFFAQVSASAGGAPAAAVLFDDAGGGPDNGRVLGIVSRGAAPTAGAPAGGGAGILRVDFPGPTLMTKVRVVDVVGSGAMLRLFDGASQVYQQPIADMAGDGFVDQYVPSLVVSAFELVLPVAGAIAEVQLMPWELVVDFDRSTTGVPVDSLAAGGEVDSGYENIGIFGGFVTASNAAESHPDKAILFDSAAPSGGDLDLVCPGPGLGNRVAREKVLIIAENDLDLDADGLVDDPDDEAAGGVLTIDFVTNTVRFRSATVIDVDDDGASFVRVYDDLTGAPHDFPLANLGDNSVQTVMGDLPTRQVELHLAGSGALAELRFGPIPFPQE